MTAMSVMEQKTHHPKPSASFMKTTQDHIPLVQPQFKRPVKRSHPHENGSHPQTHETKPIPEAHKTHGVHSTTKPFTSSDQPTVNRLHATLTQSKMQDGQVPKSIPAKRETISVKPTSHPLDKAPHAAHHQNILRQHNEEYMFTQAKKSAVQMTSTRHGYFAAHDSKHFNFLVPVIPTLQQLAEENAPTVKETDHSEIS